MDISLILLYDVNAIKSIIMHEDVISTIKDDTWDGVFRLDPDGIYVGCIYENQLIGVYYFHWITGVTLQGHAHILKKYRGKVGNESCREVMKYIMDYAPRCKKLAGLIPFIYPNVKSFLTACGFIQEGILRKSFKLNDQLHDMWIMGITRDEVEKI